MTETQYVYFTAPYNSAAGKIIREIDAAGGAIIKAMAAVDQHPYASEVVKLTLNDRLVGFSVLPKIDPDSMDTNSLKAADLRERIHENLMQTVPERLTRTLKGLLLAALTFGDKLYATGTTFTYNTSALFSHIDDLIRYVPKLKGTHQDITALIASAGYKKPRITGEGKASTVPMARVVSGEWIIAVPGQVKRRGKDHVAVVADFVPEGSAKISEEEFSATSLGLPISEFGADFPVAKDKVAALNRFEVAPGGVR